MEYIVLQPLESADPNKNISLIERKNEINEYEQSLILHESGGPFAGFIVKKAMPIQLQARFINLTKSDMSSKIKVLMKNANQPMFQEEVRILEFWFGSSSQQDRMTCLNSFFHNLLKGDFPKDYFLFLLKTMQIVKGLRGIVLLRIEIERLGEPASLETRLQKKDPKQYQDIISGKILEYLERAFPNKVSVEELARLTEAEPALVYEFLRDLFSRGLVLYYDNGTTWIRNIINQQDEQIHKVVTISQQPSVSNEEQPTIAIITVNYYEKLAVDAMMTNKITFVRHKPEGESNVYTIGKIGERRVISTKLPLISRDLRSAKISSGNATTRLLGIFQRIEHVFLVGCAGGVANYSDYEKHPRRGDIVVSFPADSSMASSVDDEESFIYMHFEAPTSGKNSTELNRRIWMPSSGQLYRLCQSIRRSYDESFGEKYPWEAYLDQGIESLFNAELDCRRPQEDKLHFTIGEKNVIEASHPEKITPGLDRRQYGLPLLRFGTIGGGDENVIKDEGTRHAISERFGVTCFDSGMDQVLESIEGNRKESYIIIKGIVDYGYGMTTKEWQPYAALSAASFAKHLILSI